MDRPDVIAAGRLPGPPRRSCWIRSTSGSTDSKVHELNVITGVDTEQFTLAGTWTTSAPRTPRRSRADVGGGRSTSFPFPYRRADAMICVEAPLILRPPPGYGWSWPRPRLETEPPSPGPRLTRSP